MSCRLTLYSVDRMLSVGLRAVVAFVLYSQMPVYYRNYEATIHRELQANSAIDLYTIVVRF